MRDPLVDVTFSVGPIGPVPIASNVVSIPYDLYDFVVSTAQIELGAHILISIENHKLPDYKAAITQGFSSPESLDIGDQIYLRNCFDIGANHLPGRFAFSWPSEVWDFRRPVYRILVWSLV